MDAATITALLGGLTGALVGAATFVQKLRAPDPEDISKLVARVEKAEDERDEAIDGLGKEREKRLLSEARVFHLLRVCQFHGIDPDTEVP